MAVPPETLTMFGGLPSESRRRSGLLYLAEGLAIGGGMTYLLIQIIALVGLFTEDTPTIGLVVFGMVLLIPALIILLGLHSDRKSSFGPTRTAVVEEWSATRRWGLVALLSIILEGLLFAISAAMHGWEEVVYYNAGLDVFAAGTFLGLALLVYGLYDRDECR